MEVSRSLKSAVRFSKRYRIYGAALPAWRKRSSTAIWVMLVYRLVDTSPPQRNSGENSCVIHSKPIRWLKRIFPLSRAQLSTWIAGKICWLQGSNWRTPLIESNWRKLPALSHCFVAKDSLGWKAKSRENCLWNDSTESSAPRLAERKSLTRS
jgi:hypothetical protein